MAILLAGAVRKVFEKQGLKLTAKPILEKKPIIEFMRRMRIFGMEKFPTPTYIASVNFYLNKKEMEHHQTFGVICLYVEQEYMARLIKLLQYPEIDEDDEEQLKDACGALCNLISGQFRSDLSLMGYCEMEMSHFSSYRNSALMGVPFYFKLLEKYEISFFIRNEKRVVMEVSMGPVPRQKKEEKKAFL